MKITAISPAIEIASALLRELDAELEARYPGNPSRGIDAVNFERAGGYFVVAQDKDRLLGCGAFRPLNDSYAEIKRMFVRPVARHRGIARSILRHLEEEIRRRKFRSIVLETGHRQPEAIGLYESEGYFPIPPFLDYVGNPVSRCYAKKT
ncbi:MAG: GNAT family N-acetyltransferase [Akkermansiaceae bacterium]|nr:GNAT family N-acetyltransferase [Verrucomicrobiales bacterium]